MKIILSQSHLNCLNILHFICHQTKLCSQNVISEHLLTVCNILLLFVVILKFFFTLLLLGYRLFLKLAACCISLCMLHVRL